MRAPVAWLAATAAFAGLLPTGGLAQPASDSGRSALLDRIYMHGAWSATSYDRLWRTWGEHRQPDALGSQIQLRYGLHGAPYPNGGLPMGLRVDSSRGMLALDCMLCHGGSIVGQSYIGLGNSALDMQSLLEDLDMANGGLGRPPLPMSCVQGTVEAFSFTARLIALRSFSVSAVFDDFSGLNAVCQDVPAWWLLKKKRTMYHTGAVSAESVRALMQFLQVPPTPISILDQSENDFVRIRDFILSLTPPPYPFPIDAGVAERGEVLFNEHCSGCHGTYGASWTYPNKIIDIDKVGTDRRLFDAMNEQWRQRYNDSWFARAGAVGGHGYSAEATAGYQAPPLDGIWATAPYLHNGSVPTLYGILNSNVRPNRFTRSFGTGEEDFDAVDVGWKIQAEPESAPAAGSSKQRRKIYDTSAPGRGNRGHVYGDKLPDVGKRAILEYLKKL